MRILLAVDGSRSSDRARDLVAALPSLDGGHLRIVSVVPTETDQQVSLSLVERTSSTKACVEMAQVYERQVALAAPLGTRQVVDARTGAVLLAATR